MTTGRLGTRILLRFGGPDWNAERNKPEDQQPGFHEAEFEFDCIDFDYGVLTVDEDLREGQNLQLAVRAKYMNECGEECGKIGWRIDPDPDLLKQRPDIEPYIGRIYGRWYVSAPQLLWKDN